MAASLRLHLSPAKTWPRFLKFLPSRKSPFLNLWDSRDAAFDEINRRRFKNPEWRGDVVDIDTNELQAHGIKFACAKYLVDTCDILELRVHVRDDQYLCFPFIPAREITEYSGR